MRTTAWLDRRGYPVLSPDIWDSPQDFRLWIPPADHPELPLEEDLAAGQRPVSGPGAGDLPAPEPGRFPGDGDPIPARMLNEFVYCPRLFYYEHVEGVFVGNADTERGRALHRKVDRGKGELKPAGTGSRGRRGAGDAEAERSPATAESRAAQDASRPEGEPEVIHSRSAMLGSARLGVIAKMDLIEVEMVSRPGGDSPGYGDGDSAQPDLFSSASSASPVPSCSREVGRVTPVDYKAGAPKEGDEGNDLWDADRMQLGLQILILRDNGYRCDEGVIYYRATRQRVPLRMTAELETWILERIGEARVAARGPIPPPLEDSPKCIRCSLAPVCLPDETRLLARAPALTRFAPPQPGALLRQHPPRRIIAARDDSRALYLTTQGTRVTLRGETLVIREEKTPIAEFRTIDVSNVALFGNIQITTQAVQWLCEAGVPVAYFSMGGWFYGITTGHGLRNVFTRIRQFAAAADPETSLWIARRFIYGKIRNQRTQLMRNHVALPDGVARKLKRAAADALTAGSLTRLLGIEGAAAALCFGNFNGLIKIGTDDDRLPGIDPPEKRGDSSFRFDFTRRSRRPPTDPVNALLSLAYSLLARDCTIACLTTGFDPYVGYYHQPRHGRPALALDLMEEFRPLIADSAVLTAINNRMITPAHFVRAGNAVNLTAAGRKAFFHAYEQRINSLVTHPVFDYKVSYRRVLELQARMLARYLTGEIPEYIPMMTR